MEFNIIGAGRLGKALAYALAASKLAKLKAVCNAHFYTAKITTEQIGSGLAVSSLAELPAADLTFITTTDELIPTVAKQLAYEKIIKPQSIIVHCSGALSSEELSPLRAFGCKILSLHPLKAFKIDTFDVAIFQDCHCVIEGDAEAVQVTSSLFNQLGAKLSSINSQSKTLYHAAAVIASNYLVTLAATAIELFKEAGIETKLAKEMTTHLMAGSLANLKESETAKEALTGPLQRGDLKTLAQHLQALPSDSTKSLYKSALLATLPITTLSHELKTKVQELVEPDLRVSGSKTQSTD